MSLGRPRIRVVSAFEGYKIFLKTRFENDAAFWGNASSPALRAAAAGDASALSPAVG